MGAVSGLAVAWWAWTLHLGPLSDDFVIRQWAVERNWLPTTWPFARPLPLLVWASIVDAGGGWVSLHLLNVSLHALNVALVLRLGRIGFGPAGGAVAGLLFLFFPAHAEAVAWTAGVFDLASCAGVLIALNAWCSLLPTFHRSALLTLGMVVALASKESAIVLPVLLVIVECTLRRGSWEPGRVLTAAIIWCGTLTYLAWRATMSPGVAGHLSQLPSSRYQLKELLVRPFGALVAPVRTDGDEFVLAASSALAVLGILAVGLVSTWSSTSPPLRVWMMSAGLRLGLVWPLVAVAPLLMQFYVSDTLEGSRYIYLSVVGFSLFLGSTVASTGGPWRWAASAALTVLLGLWLAAGIGERQIWRDAAATRDAVLAQVARLAIEHDCAAFELRHPPDNVRGAYVLREGSVIAVREAVSQRAGSVACVAEWSGSEVRMVE